MAIFDSRTPCTICRLPLGSDECVAFPPFVRNRLDPLYTLNDAVAHAACLSSSAFGAVAMSARQSAIARVRTCRACQQAIEPREPAFCAGLLTSNPGVDAFKFNDACIHLAHYSDWSDAGEFDSVVSAWMASSEWKGPKIVFEPLPRWVADVDEKRETHGRTQVLKAGFGRRSPPKPK